jgi:hypothetical protein
VTRRIFSSVLAFAALAGISVAFAPAAFGDNGGVSNPPGVFTNFKTPPLATSENFILPIDIHHTGPNPGWAGWAGAIMDVHIIDPNEVDIVGITPFGGATIDGTPIFGPLSAQGTATHTFTFFNPAANLSGILVGTSDNNPIFNITIHAKNTTGANNSDFNDIALSFWNIWHVQAGSAFASHPVVLKASDRIWVRSTITTTDDFFHIATGPEVSMYVFPSGPPATDDPNAHWFHLVNTVTFHLTTGPGSTIYATKLLPANIGIEHVPEPATGLLVGAGLVMVALSRRYAARRRQS